jgi:D-alanyl-D-alanine carboxypeptidase (penicillin-binding protein 5/6)
MDLQMVSKRRWPSLVAAMVIAAAAWGGTGAAFAREAAKPSGDFGLAENARSAVLMDAATGQILFEKNSHERLPPASITKIMTMLLVMEAIRDGKVKLTDKVRTSEYAASMGGSQVFLQPGEEMTLDDLMKAVAVASANDASVAVAEHVAGSDKAFVAMMNERAKELGLRDTHFENVNGLPAPNHYSSAHDIAVMSRELLKYGEVTRWTSIYSDYLRKDSEKPFWLVNTNKLVKFYPGMDGLKTGYTAEAKYCLSATAVRGHFRAIAVVMGEPTSPTRNMEVSRMLDYAFSQYQSQRIYQQGEPVRKVRINKGEEPEIDALAAETVAILMKKGEKPSHYHVQVVLEPVAAPVRKGQPLGYVLVSKNGETVSRTALVAGQDVGRAGFFRILGRTFREWFAGGA